MRILLACLGNRHWNFYVRLFELALFLQEYLGANTVDDGVLSADHVLQLLLACEIGQFHVGFVAQICSWLDLLEL